MTIAAGASSSGRASRNLGAVMLGRGKAPRVGRTVWSDHVVHDLRDVERAALELGPPVARGELPFGGACGRRGWIQRKRRAGQREGPHGTRIGRHETDV